MGNYKVAYWPVEVVGYRVESKLLYFNIKPPADALVLEAPTLSEVRGRLGGRIFSSREEARKAVLSLQRKPKRQRNLWSWVWQPYKIACRLVEVVSYRMESSLRSKSPEDALVVEAPTLSEIRGLDVSGRIFSSRKEARKAVLSLQKKLQHRGTYWWWNLPLPLAFIVLIFGPFSRFRRMVLILVPLVVLVLLPLGIYLKGLILPKIIIIKEDGRVVEKPKPPHLTFKLSLHDESGDNVLEGGGEKMTLRVDVKNERSREGKPTGVARGVKVAIIPKEKISGVTFPQSLEVGEMPPGTEKTVTGTFTANLDVPEGRVAFRVEVVEASDFHADPQEIVFQVIPFHKPVLRIARHWVEAGANQQIDLGEEVTLFLVVHNDGPGRAEKVKAQLVTPSTNIMATDAMDKVVGDLSPGSQKEVHFSFTVTKRFTGQGIPLTVKLREDRAKAEASANITLPVNAYLPPPLIVALPPKPESPGPTTAGSGLPKFEPVADVDQYIQNLPEPSWADQTKWAVVIGIERYRKATPVPFARNDALAIREYLRKLLGVPREHIFFLLDDQATLGEMREVLEDRLPRRLVASKGRVVYVYFAGHGIANQEDGQPYLLLSDGHPESPKAGGYALHQLYNELDKLAASQIYVFLDACFSGGSRSGETLLAGAHPGVLRVEDPVLLSKTLLVFTAAKGKQLSNWFPAQQHSLFTYYVLKGLMGAADSDRDKGVQAWELAAYLQEHVPREARLLFGQQRDQEPEVKPAGLEGRRDWVIR